MEYDPSSYSYREGIGQPSTQVPIRLANFRIWGGQGVPASTLGATGDFYFRQDGGGAGATHIYFNNAGWIGIA